MRTSSWMALCAVLLLSACHRGSQPSKAAGASGARPAAAARNVRSVAALTVGMVEAASFGKSTVPVRLKFDLLQRPAVGAPLSIDLALVALAAADSATIDIAATTEFNVAPADRQFTLLALHAGTVYRHSLSVTPTVGGGVSLLDLTVTVHRDGIAEVRHFTLPVIVAGASAASAPPAASMAK